MIRNAKQPVTAPISRPLSTQEIRAQVRRILASTSFRNAPVLQSFLEYVTAKSLEQDIAGTSEFAIARQVFGRPPGFDPSSDTIVRTHAYRLRGKLKEYYESEGGEDLVLLEIPKGHYMPAFALRSASRPASVAVTKFKRLPLPRTPIHLAILAATTVLLLGSGFWMGWSSHSPVPPPLGFDPSDPVVAFWKSFLSDDKEPQVAYSNAVFLDTDAGDLLRFGGGMTADRGAAVSPQVAAESARSPGLLDKAGPLFYEDGYTGTGEVSAAFRIATVLTRLGVNAIAKRSRTASIDDLRSHSFIFLGSVIQNASLADIPQPGQFFIEEPQTPPYLWASRIVNKRPAAGEASFYQTERDAASRVIKADYAVFSILPGPHPERKIMVLAGLTTSGTQGAAEFACSPAALAGLKKMLGSRGAFPNYFECILRVETSKGLDAAQGHLVACRVIQRAEP